MEVHTIAHWQVAVRFSVVPSAAEADLYVQQQIAVPSAAEAQLCAQQQRRTYHKWTVADKMMALEAAEKFGHRGREKVVRSLHQLCPDRFGTLTEAHIRSWEKAARQGGSSGQAGTSGQAVVGLICEAIQGQIKAGKQPWVSTAASFGQGPSLSNCLIMHMHLYACCLYACCLYTCWLYAYHTRTHASPGLAGEFRLAEFTFNPA